MKQEHKATDKRGRNWEMFIDESYFHLWCVKLETERNFNSQLSFHFLSAKTAEEFLNLIKESR